jgi:hypothetical protein
MNLRKASIAGFSAAALSMCGVHAVSAQDVRITGDIQFNDVIQTISDIGNGWHDAYRCGYQLNAQSGKVEPDSRIHEMTTRNDRSRLMVVTRNNNGTPSVMVIDALKPAENVQQATHHIILKDGSIAAKTCEHDFRADNDRQCTDGTARITAQQLKGYAARLDSFCADKIKTFGAKIVVGPSEVQPFQTSRANVVIRQAQQLRDLGFGTGN